jgi:hypothetical protein
LEPRPKGSRPDNAVAKEGISTAPNGVAAPPTHIASVPTGPAGTGVPSSILPSKAAAAPSLPRPSRFFPPKDVRQDNQILADHDRSPSPPPPTMAGHPVYDGDVAHPHVSLPRPQPVVKLPPAPTPPTAPPSSTSATTRGSKKGDVTFAWANPAPYRGTFAGSSAPTISAHPQHVQHLQTSPGHQSHLALHMNSAPHSQQEWQEKIYELTGRRSGPPKSPAVESASRASLDYSARVTSATVVLPGGFGVAKDSGDVMTKPMADECFEEQEMGSLPPVRIPHKAPEAGWQPALAPKPLPRKFGTTTTSAEVLDLGGTGPAICVYLPTAGHAVPKILPWNRQPTPSRASFRGSSQVRPGGPRSRGTRGGFRDGKRESSSLFPSDATTSNNASPSGPLSSSGRGRTSSRGGRSGGAEWSRRSGQPSTNV